ncbi:hypothetical protein [Nocardia brasiliensis]
MTFEVNGYRLSELRKDPAAVENALADLAQMLLDAREHMEQIGRPDLADHLDELSRQLHVSGTQIDDNFDDAFREITGAAADPCRAAAGPDGMRTPKDPNEQIYRALTWGLVALVIVRIGGVGTILHPGLHPGESSGSNR